MRPRRAHRISPRLLPLLALCCTSGAALAGDLERDRAAFIDVYPQAARGNWTPVARVEPALRDYVLWPDLRAAYLRARLRQAPAGEIEHFLARYGDIRPGRNLRYRWARQLARSERWGEFLALYDRHYAAAQDIHLDCLAAQALLVTGERERAAGIGLALWPHGRSRPAECDPVFDYLAGSGRLDEARYRQRLALALEAREFALARYLARRIDAAARARVDQWIAMRRDPAAALVRSGKLADTAANRALLAYGIERLARKDALYAERLWRRLSTDFAFDPARRAAVEAEIALVAAWRGAPGARVLLARVSDPAAEPEVLRWRVRLALKTGDWQEVLAAIAAMPEREAAGEMWRYWRAWALLERASPAAGRAILRELATERSYYGFLAADYLDRPYAIEPAPIPEQREMLTRVAAEPALVRARELFLTGLERDGRAEWTAALERLTDAEKSQAAILADRWGWHSRAIATAAAAELWDAIELRYPLPFRTQFENSAELADIDPTWAYGIARSESLFMPDVRSSAGAVGLMQLMPATGRATARAARLPYRGHRTLVDPASNIALGSWYLGEMYRRFSEHRVLATAAYNAGPHRVERWLPRETAVDAAIWIETIPFDETRKYVRRVLEAQTIFHWRLHGDVRRVSASLQPIPAADGTRLLAQRSR